MSKELLVSVAIGATLKAGFTTVFGQAEKTAAALGTEIKAATKQSEAFGRSLRRQAAMNPSRNLAQQSQQYAALTVEIGKATRAQDSLNRSIASQQAATARRQQLRSEMVETGGHAAVIAAPVIGAVKTFMQQETASANLKVSMMQSDGSFGEYEALNKLATEWAKELPGSRSTYTNMINGLKSQGLSDKTIKEGGGLATAQLNVVIGNDIEDGTFFAKNMEAHGIKEQDLLQSAELTQRAYFAAGLTKDDMYQAMSYYAPKANTLGLTGLENQKQIYTVEGLSANKGLEGSSFGTNFSMMLSQLSKGPQMVAMATKGAKAEVREMLESSGAKFEFFNKDGSMRSLRDITGELETGFNKIRSKYGEKGVMDAADALFGQEGGRVAAVMGQAGLKGFDDFNAKMDNQASLQDRIKVRTNTLASSLEQLGGVVENTAGIFGEIFAPDIRAFADTAQGLIENTIAPFIQNNKGLIKSVFGLLAGFFALKLGILGIAYAGSMVMMPFNAMAIGGKKLMALNSMWRMMRLSNVTKGVAALRMFGLSAGTAAKVAAVFGRFVAPIAPIFARIGMGAGFIGKAQIALGLLRVAIMAVGRAFLTTPIGWVALLVAGAALLIYKYWNPIKAFFIGLWEGLQQGLAPLAPMFEGIGQMLSGVWQTIQPFVQPILDWFGEFFSVSQVAEGGARSFGQTVGLWIGEKITAVATWVSLKITEIKTAFGGGLTGILGLILNWSPLGAFYSAFASVMSWFGVTLPASFTGFGRMLLDGLIRGIQSRVQAVVGTVSSVVNRIKSAFTNPVEIKSPSRLFKKYGAFIMQGLEIGLGNNASRPVSQISSLATSLQERFKNQSSPLSLDMSAQLKRNSEEFAAARSQQQSPDSAGGITVYYSPTIQAAGGAVEQIQQVLSIDKFELESMLRRLLEDKTRRAY